MDDQDHIKAFSDPIEEGNEGQCRALWLAVILQAILDARGKYGNSVEQRQAKIWFKGRGGPRSAFAAVCDLAGVDFEKTRKRCQLVLADSSGALDFRVMKRDKEENRTAKGRRRYLKRAERNANLRLARGLALSAANDNRPNTANDNSPRNLQTSTTTKHHGEE
jgi:hypothetical protein